MRFARLLFRTLYISVFLSTIIAIGCIITSASAFDDVLSLEEAKKLLYEANQMYLTWQDGINADGIGHPVTTTVSEVSCSAREIYVDRIADRMWKYQCSMPLLPNGEPREKHIDEYLTYQENSDGTITTIPFIPMSIRKFDIKTWYGKLNGKNDSSDRPNSPQDIVLRNLVSRSGSASAELMIYYFSSDPVQYPVWIGVEFEQTANGWRISGGSLVYAFADWENPELHFDAVYENFPVLYNIEKTISEAIFFQDSDAVPKPEETVWYNMTGLKLIYVDEGFCEFVVQFEEGVNKDGFAVPYLFSPSEKLRTYNAIFTYIHDYEISPGHKIGAWKLTGGGCYELAHGNENVSPYTGDRAGMLAAITLASLLCLSACVIFRRKKKAE